MLYQLYDFQHAAWAPVRLLAELTQTTFQHPLVPAAYTRFGRTLAAGAELLERTTRRFGKPAFGLTTTVIDGESVPVAEVTAEVKPFCRLLHFARATTREDPRVLLVAPMSGHHATLLRGTIEALLPAHDVYVTDWVDARQVPLARGHFDLDDYIAYVLDFIKLLGRQTHVVAVCQPAVPVLAAVALMAAAGDPDQPLSMTLMGGPIDTRCASTTVTRLAETRSLAWFERTLITALPVYYPGALRRVYPGFVQLTGFMSMNLDRHLSAHIDLFGHLVRGDGESAESHRAFYDEYMSVMDLPAEFYLQTVSTVFQRHAPPEGTMRWRGQSVEPRAIRRTALMTVEGELDDISAPGQTRAAHPLCADLAPEQRSHHLQAGVGHYGIFNGRRWREEVMPAVRAFIRNHES